MHKLILGNELINYSIEYSRKAKNKRVAISPSGVRVVLPFRSSEQEGIALIESVKRRVYRARERILIQEKKRKNLTELRYVSGSKIPLLGNEVGLTVVPEKRKRSRIEYDGNLTIRVQAGLTSKEVENEVRRRVERWIKEQLLTETSGVVQVLGKKIGVFPKGIRIKAQKKIWGSCSRNHVINLNWKLGLFPRKVFEYVVVHEMCHLRYMNHSQRFWKLVASVMPDFKKQRDWLKFRGHKEE
jgi:hypothetical protein